MLIFSCLFFAWFLYRPVKSGLSDDESNIAINKQRQEELAFDINQGLIDDEQFKFSIYSWASSFEVFWNYSSKNCSF